MTNARHLGRACGVDASIPRCLAILVKSLLTACRGCGAAWAGANESWAADDYGPRLLGVLVMKARP